MKKYYKKSNKLKKFSNNIVNFKDKKKKTVGFFKTRKISTIIEALKKMKKRKSSNNNEVKVKAFGFDVDKKPNKTTFDEKKIQHPSKKLGVNFNKDLKKFKSKELENDKRESDIFNLIDEFLYKKKLERGRKCNLIE